MLETNGSTWFWTTLYQATQLKHSKIPDQSGTSIYSRDPGDGRLVLGKKDTDEHGYYSSVHLDKLVFFNRMLTAPEVETIFITGTNNSSLWSYGWFQKTGVQYWKPSLKKTFSDLISRTQDSSCPSEGLQIWQKAPPILKSGTNYQKLLYSKDIAVCLSAKSIRQSGSWKRFTSFLSNVIHWKPYRSIHSKNFFVILKPLLYYIS